MKKSFEIIVSGTVQGIGYRYFAVRSANMLNIKGFIRNLYDGRVQVVACGEEGKIRAFIDILGIGPIYAAVSKLTVNEIETTEHYKDFRVEY